jgi:hypothetical protein
MGNKTDDTPFHLRMTCLHMAKDILAERMHMTKEVQGNTATEFYQTEDVLAEAAKLYRFVCDRNAADTYQREG